VGWPEDLNAQAVSNCEQSARRHAAFSPAEYPPLRPAFLDPSRGRGWVWVAHYQRNDL